MKRWKCLVCGHIFEGDTPPVPCPVCGAGEASFVLLEDGAPAQWRCTVCGQLFDGDAPPVPCPVCGANAAAFERVEATETLWQKDTDDRFVIVGGGLAGLEAAKAIRARNATASITMVSGENHLPYNRPALSRVLADGLSFANLLLEEEDFYQRQNIEIISGVLASTVEPAAKTVTLTNGTVLPYTKLLLATGAKPFNPIKHAHGSIPVKVLRCYEDAVDLMHFAAGKRVVLVGGGILGLEAAVALRSRGAAVTVVEYASRILPLQTDEAVSAMLAGRLEKLGIGLLCGASVTEATRHGVVLNDGASMAADLVLASMGVRSEMALAVNIGLELSRGIVVDEFMRTSHPDIWAAGDCAEYNGRVQAIAGAASSMGAVAGAAMAGDLQAPYQPFVPATVFEVQGFSLFSAGAVSQETEESALYQNKATKQYRRLFFAGGKLCGVLYVGQNPGAKALRALAAKTPAAEAFSLLHT